MPLYSLFTGEARQTWMRWQYSYSHCRQHTVVYYLHCPRIIIDVVIQSRRVITQRPILPPARPPPARGSSTLSPKVNLHHEINFRAVSKDEMAPTWVKFDPTKPSYPTEWACTQHENHVFPCRERPLLLTTYRGTSLIRNTPLLEPYSRTIPRVLW